MSRILPCLQQYAVLKPWNLQLLIECVLFVCSGQRNVVLSSVSCGIKDANQHLKGIGHMTQGLYPKTLPEFDSSSLTVLEPWWNKMILFDLKTSLVGEVSLSKIPHLRISLCLIAHFWCMQENPPWKSTTSAPEAGDIQ